MAHTFTAADKTRWSLPFFSALCHGLSVIGSMDETRSRSTKNNSHFFFCSQFHRNREDSTRRRKRTDEFNAVGLGYRGDYDTCMSNHTSPTTSHSAQQTEKKVFTNNNCKWVLGLGLRCFGIMLIRLLTGSSLVRNMVVEFFWWLLVVCYCRWNALHDLPTAHAEHAKCVFKNWRNDK